MKIKFRSPRRKNPFDNPLVSMFAHTLVTVVAALALFYSLKLESLWPLYLAGVFVTLLEGAWLYFMLRT